MKIERSALVTHSAKNMFLLVQDVPSYPDFLSWCTSSEVLEQDEQVQKASLTVSVAGINQHFTTENHLSEGHFVKMKLLEGPFKNLQGEWGFVQLGEDGSRVSLMLDFEMTSGFVGTLFGKGFGRIADRLVDDFCKRADEVYS